MLPAGAIQGGTTRGAKNPWTPNIAVAAIVIRLRAGRHSSTDDGGMKGEWADERSQNSRSAATRFSGGLPAISVELIAPIEIPTTQSGWIPASANSSKARLDRRRAPLRPCNRRMVWSCLPAVNGFAAEGVDLVVSFIILLGEMRECTQLRAIRSLLFHCPRRSIFG